MNKIALLFCLISVSAFAKVQNIKMDEIGYGSLVHINAQIQLPDGQKLNQGAPSNITVFEKEDDKWVETRKMSLKDFFSMTGLIRFQQPVKLRSEKSDLKVTANIYHCEKLKNTMCVIDDFEGFVGRKKSTIMTEISMKLAGSDPKRLYKK